MPSLEKREHDIQVRFIHAADLHLDSPLRGLVRYDGAPADRLRLATRRAAENLVDLAIQEEVAFVVIAGDVFDGDWPDYNTGLFFVRQLVRLRDAGIHVYLIRGNHDAISQVTKSLRLPDNVVEFGAEHATSIEVPNHPVVVHGHSFASQAVRQNLALSYPEAVDGFFNIGILHTSATGREGHETYSPCTVDDLLQKGYDYWALGHIHKREVLHESPPIVFSGNIQGRHIRETGPKGCYVVSVRHDRSIASLEFRPLDIARWMLLQVDVTEADSSDRVLDRIADSLRGASSDADGRLLCIRIELQGSSSLHDDLFSRREEWTSEIRNIAMQVTRDQLWIEKVDLRGLSAPDSSSDDPARNGVDIAGPWAALESLWIEWRSNPERVAASGFSLEDLLTRLPHQVSRELASVEDPQFLEVLEEAQLRLKSKLFGKEYTNEN